MNESYDKLQIEIEENCESYYIKTHEDKVSFIISFITLEDDNPNGKYLVKVREITDLYLPQDIIRQFFTKDQQKEARIMLKKMLEDYKAISNATLPPIDPKKVFKDSVQYHIIRPDCCDNCMFAIYRHECKDSKRQFGEKIYCRCYKNMKQYEYIHDNAHQKIFEDIEVNKFGICNNHCRRENS